MLKECRICLDTVNQSSMISPCDCKGTMLYVHRNCLEKWRTEKPSAYQKCTECKFTYILQLKRLNFLTFQQIITDPEFLCGIWILFLFLVICSLFNMAEHYKQTKNCPTPHHKETSISLISIFTQSIFMTISAYGFYSSIEEDQFPYRIIIFIPITVVTSAIPAIFEFLCEPAEFLFFSLSVIASMTNIIFFFRGIRSLIKKINEIGHHYATDRNFFTST